MKNWKLYFLHFNISETKKVQKKQIISKKQRFVFFFIENISNTVIYVE